jgi:hypothetical protein
MDKELQIDNNSPMDDIIQSHRDAILYKKRRLEMLQKKFDDASKIRRGRQIVKDKDGNIIGEVEVSAADELRAMELMCKLNEQINKIL